MKKIDIKLLGKRIKLVSTDQLFHFRKRLPSKVIKYPHFELHVLVSTIVYCSSEDLKYCKNWLVYFELKLYFLFSADAMI